MSPRRPSPQQLRKALAPEIDTDYVAHIDYDVAVSPGNQP